MTHRSASLLLGLVAAAVAACQPAGMAPAAPPAPGLVQAAGLVLDARDGQASVTLSARVASARRLLAPPPAAPYAASQIATTALSLHRLDGPEAGLRQTGTITGDPSGTRVTLSNLRAGASYRLDFVAKGSWGGVISQPDQSISFSLDAQGVANLTGPVTIKLLDDVLPGTVFSMPGFEIVEGGTPLKGFVTTFASLGEQPLGSFAVAADGAAYYVVSGGIRRRNPDGSADATFVGTGYSNPKDVAIDPTGAYLYVAEAGNNRVSRVPIAGGAPVAFGTTVPAPAALAFGPDGQLYVATAGRVVRFDAAGAYSVVLSAETLGAARATNLIAGDTSDMALEYNRGRIALAAATVQIAGMDFDAKGNLIVAEAGYKDAWRLAPDGVATALRGLPFTPVDVVVGADNRSYFAATNAKLYMMDYADQPVVFAGGGTPASAGAAGTAAGFAGITGLARDRDGFVYVAEPGPSPRIRKVL